jgi:RNA polymerase sigma-70 factor (ECF subfamily)
MNQNEFMQLVNPFKDKLFRIAKRLLVSTEEAEDATQEVLAKLWKRNESLDEFKSVEAVAMTMTKNYCFDQLKSRHANTMRIVHNNFSDSEASVQEKIEETDTWKWVEKIINDLPEKQKLIIQMRDIEEMGYEQISQILEMNEQAIRTALSRARKEIREKMIKKNHYGIR